MDSVESAPAQGAAVRKRSVQHSAVEAPPPPPAAFGAAAATALPSDYVPAAESHHELYQVEVDSFVGPLDLLLFLIRRHALDIFDIPMAFVCQRYLDVLDRMAECDIDVAAEFLAVAAELLHIKSRMLLPQEKAADDDVEVDPRAALVRRLLLLETFQKAALMLAKRPQLGRDVFAAPGCKEAPPIRPLAAMSPLRLCATLAALDKRRRPTKRHQVMVEQIPLRQRMRELLVAMHSTSGPLLLANALARMTARIDVIVLFLAVLELAKQHLLTIDRQRSAGQADAEPAGSVSAGLTMLARCGSLAESERRLERVDVEEAFN